MFFRSMFLNENGVHTTEGSCTWTYKIFTIFSSVMVEIVYSEVWYHYAALNAIEFTCIIQMYKRMSI